MASASAADADEAIQAASKAFEQGPWSQVHHERPRFIRILDQRGTHFVSGMPPWKASSQESARMAELEGLHSSGRKRIKNPICCWWMTGKPVVTHFGREERKGLIASVVEEENSRQFHADRPVAASAICRQTKSRISVSCSEE